MSTAVELIQTELASVVGESHVVTDSAQCAAYAVDGKAPKYVVYPPSAERVAAVLKWAADHDLAVIPCHNATKLTIGSPPARYDIALSLKQLNNIWHYEPADLTVSTEPGVKFSDFQDFVGRHNLWLPLDPPMAGRASLGGILATNSSGPLRLRYGTPRDMVLGLRIATAEGKVIKTGGRVVKNVAGYDFSKLLVGSYGTLGVIVEANLKLYPKSAERTTFVPQASSLETARNLRRRILSSPLQPLRMVVLNGLASTLVRGRAASSSPAQAAEMWVETGGSARATERYAQEFHDLGKAAGVSVERCQGADAEALWARISDFRTWMSESYPNTVIMKATLPIPAGEQFLARTQQEAENEHARLASFGQTGIGVVYLAFPDDVPLSAMVSLIKRLRKVAEEFRGTLVLERCAPDIKGAVDVWGTRGDDLEIMRKIKRAWDPKGILAPGRLLGSV